MSELNPSASFAAFAAAADAVGATTKRLQKSAILADYLAGLNDDDLPIACRFLSELDAPANAGHYSEAALLDLSRRADAARKMALGLDVRRLQAVHTEGQ